MELNLASSITHNLTSAQENSGQLLEGFAPRVQLRETRSAYFVNVNLSGFRKEDIRLEMDNTRTLIIRGQRYIQGMGKVEWTWHLMESGGRSFRKPFRVPQNVNVGAMTGTFHQGVLHVLMPKFRWTSRFTPYHINRSNSQDDQALEEAVEDEAKESAGGGHGAEKQDDFVGTRSNEEKDTHDQKPPAISTVEEQSHTDSHVQQEGINEVVAAASTSYDNTKESLQQHQPITTSDLHHEEPSSCLGSKGEAGEEVAEKEKKDAASTSYDNIEDPLQQHQPITTPDLHHEEPSSCLGSKAEEVAEKEKKEAASTSYDNTEEPLQQHQPIRAPDLHNEKPSCLGSKGKEVAEKEKKEAASTSYDNTEEPLQQHQPIAAPDLHHEKPSSCLGSKDEEAARKEEKTVVENIVLLTDYKEKDDQQSQQKDALEVPAEEVIAQQEAASETGEDTDDGKQEPETDIYSNGIDEYWGIISQWNYGETFWSRRKIAVAVLVSSVAAIAAFKLMRR